MRKHAIMPKSQQTYGVDTTDAASGAPHCDGRINPSSFYGLALRREKRASLRYIRANITLHDTMLKLRYFP